jgi:hypothetical protein
MFFIAMKMNRPCAYARNLTVPHICGDELPIAPVDAVDPQVLFYRRYE